MKAKKKLIRKKEMEGLVSRFTLIGHWFKIPEEIMDEMYQIISAFCMWQLQEKRGYFYKTFKKTIGR